MLVRLQYADDSVWEGPPGEVLLSPDPRPKASGWVYEPNAEGWGGIIRMVAIDDFGRRLVFAYHDFYYVCDTGDGAWEFGSGAQNVKFILRRGQDGTSATPVPFVIPAGSVVRVGVTVSQEDAVRHGLIGDIDEKQLHAKSHVIIVQVG